MKIKALAALFIIGILSISGQNREIIYDYNAEKEYRDIEERYTLSPYAMFGDSTKTLTTKHESEQDYTLKIPINDGLFEINMRTGLVTLKDDKSIVTYSKQLTNEEKARFVTIDPHAENYYSWSPYAYCANNPLRFIDPSGKDWIENAKTGDVEWRHDATKDKVPDGYTYIGTEYKGITIYGYEFSNYPTTDGNSFTQLTIRIGYKDPNTQKQSNYNWVQTYERDDVKKSIDYDSKTESGKANFPYYQDITENKNSRNVDGYDIIYFDRPDESQKNGHFNAELSLIGDPIASQVGNLSYPPNAPGGKNIHQPIITMAYGFSVKNGKAVASPVKVVSPSPSQKRAIGLIF